jgi:glucokinase
VPTRELGSGPVEERVDRFAATLVRLVPEGCQLAGVGIGASGPIDTPSGIIQNPGTLPWFSGFDFRGALRAALGVPVFVENDAVTAALGEHRYGAGRGCDRLLVVTLGTGIGVALLEDGQPFRDVKGQHPECGHLPVLPGGPRCYCGITGCWEMLASRGNLEARVERALGSRDLNKAERLLAEGADEGLRVVFRDYGSALGRGLAVLNIAYGPERVVICGSVSRFLPYFAPGALAELDRAPGFRSQVKVVESDLGDLAGAIGASLLVGPTSQRS